jgi:hypothetical protein
MGNGFINISNIFRTKPALFMCPYGVDHDYRHIVDLDDVENTKFDIIRSLPWFDELALTHGYDYNAKPDPVEAVLYQKYFVENEGLFESLLKDSLFDDNKMIFVLGEPGSGKTTVMNFILRHSHAFKAYREKHDILILTCNRAFGSNKDIKSSVEKGLYFNEITLRDSVILHLGEAVNAICEKYGCLIEDLYHDVVKKKPLAVNIQKAIRRLKNNELNGEEYERVVHSLLSGTNFINRALDWFEVYQSDKKFDVVLDNMDCFSKEERESCFVAVLPMIIRKNTRVIIPMRQPTFADYTHSDAINQYTSTSPPIALCSARFKDILQKRLTNVPSDIKKYDSVRWNGLIKEIKDHLLSGDVIELFNGVFGEDNREKLKALKFIMESPLLPTPNEYGFADNVLRALILGNHMIAIDDYRYSKVRNLFRAGETGGYQNTLVKIRVLQKINELGPLQVDAEKIIEDLFVAGYQKNVLINAVNSFLRDDLIEVFEKPDIKKIDLNKIDSEGVQYKLQLTQIGDFYLNNLILNKVYVELMAQSAHIKMQFLRRHNDRIVVEELNKKIRKEENEGVYLREMYDNYSHQIFVSLDDFVMFIKSEEEEESIHSKGALDKYCIAEEMDKKFKL